MKKLEKCECCRFPIVDKHHLLRMCDYGENTFVINLCPNCHRLYHLIYNHIVLGSKGLKLGLIILELGINDKRIKYLYSKVLDIERLESEIGIAVIKELRNDNDPES